MSRYNAPGEILPFSDRKALRDEYVPPPIEDIVRIQQLDCQGLNIDAIAEATGLRHEDIRHVLNPEPVERGQERAGLRYQHMKAR